VLKTLQLTAIAAGLVLIAWNVGGWGWTLLWPALSFLLVALGYAGIGPGIFGKRRDGTLPLVRVLVLGPFLAVTWLLWMAGRLLSREPCCHEVAPCIWVGRRIVEGELPRGIQRIVDLTAEFQEPKGIRQRDLYWSMPALDASAPALDDLEHLLQTLHTESHPIFLHCASGHGRSAMVAAGLLIGRGLARDVPDAEAQLRRIRPHIRLNSRQRQQLKAVLARRQLFDAFS
jgi:protein-tyrosine phosphatase